MHIFFKRVHRLCVLVSVICLTGISYSAPQVYGDKSLRTINAQCHGPAWVLPTFYHPVSVHGKRPSYVLLARERWGADAGTYDAFGGSADPGDKHPYVTAAREFYEETIAGKTFGMTRTTIEQYIQNASIAIISPKNLDYVLYITPFSATTIKHAGTAFYQALKDPKLSHHYKEKDKLAWVALDDLATAVVNKQPKKHVTVNAFLIEPKTKSTLKKPITIRPVLTKMLKPFVTGMVHA